MVSIIDLILKLFLVVIALIGLDTLRNDKRKSEYQIAKDILVSVYKIEEEFKQVRWFGGFTKNHKENIKEYLKRFEKLDLEFNKLEENISYAYVEWGRDHIDKIKDFRICRLNLMDVIQKYIDMNGVLKKEDEAILKGGLEFTKKIDTAIEKFETWLRPKIVKKPWTTKLLEKFGLI